MIQGTTPSPSPRTERHRSDAFLDTSSTASVVTVGPRALATALVRAWRDAGTSVLFGVPGGGANLDVVGAAAEDGIRFVLTHDETAAGIMASTHGLLTGTVGAAVVTRGPGATAAATGLAQATLDRSPLLLVSDTVPERSAARVAHQRIDEQAMTRPIAKWSGTLGTENPAQVAAAAVGLARRGPAGGVHLSMDPTAPGSSPPPSSADAALDEGATDRASAMMTRAKRPVVLVGLAATDHPGLADALLATGLPVLCTYQAKGAVPDARSAGLFTGGVLERPLLDRADIVLAVGVDPVELIPARWPYEAPVVMLHPEPVDGSWFGDPEIVVGPLATTLPTVLGDAFHRWESGTAEDARREALDTLETGGGEFGPHDVVREVARAVGSSTTLTVDAGAHMLVAMPFWEATAPRRVLISNGLATMGFSLPAAVGAALARPGSPVVCFVGDGGLGMTLAELETVVRLDLDVTVVVFNDAALSLIEIKQTDGQGDANAVRYGTTDFAAIASGMGMRATIAEHRQALRHELDQARTGPRLIDVRISPATYAHVLTATRG
ncbi:thiamine pyrophosphate-binding protein [Actinomycetospora straminea]|uniref:Acetolactate synthase large subunit n=1 Tax=Actinomycetospora straminea TaxID=663607 RepID=A0ABP9EGV0_9PSEU|nr:thiamine pyrophosphate-binding protein [Actinomycetospora straminea]MDD7933768.1 thiamine pyrophosphate-binding protein [Actinomycetospora straminea]